MHAYMLGELLHMCRHTNWELRERVDAMHATFDTAAQRITQAHTDKEHFRRLWEGNRMYMEDLDATMKR